MSSNDYENFLKELKIFLNDEKLKEKKIFEKEIKEENLSFGEKIINEVNSVKNIESSKAETIEQAFERPIPSIFIKSLIVISLILWNLFIYFHNFFERVKTSSFFEPLRIKIAISSYSLKFSNPNL